MLWNVMTWNLRVDLEQDGIYAWTNRAKSAATLVQQHQPMIAATQEGKLHMLHDLADSLHNYSWIGTDRKGGMNDEFCAIFYRTDKLNCLKSGKFWLSENPEKAGSIGWNSDFPRICTWAHFQFKNEPTEEVLVYNTHLDHMNQQAREKGMALILTMLQKHQTKLGVPVILTGDFNAEPDNAVLHLLNRSSSQDFLPSLQNAYKAIDGTPGKTFHGFEGGKTGEPIDYIFCSGNITIKDTFIDRSLPCGTYPSDHYPVICSLDL